MTPAGRPVSLIRLFHLTDKSKSSELFAFARFRNQVSQVNQVKRPLHGRKEQPKMAAKTKTITVQVDERLASEIEGTTEHNWRTTTFASGKRRVYATFESVKTVGGMK